MSPVLPVLAGLPQTLQQIVGLKAARVLLLRAMTLKGQSPFFGTSRPLVPVRRVLHLVSKEQA